MIAFDLNQGHVLYTAEEAGKIHRIDMRVGKEELLFRHLASTYQLSCPEEERALAGPFFPSWPGLGSVKVVVQSPFVDFPHLVIGGSGYFIGMLDLRLVPNQADENRTSFIKLWSPALPYENDSLHSKEVLDYYSDFQPYYPFGRRSHPQPPPPPYRSKPARWKDISLSGLDLTKDGSALLANFQGDQIYTFNFRNAAATTGANATMGGHINYSTFLKSVSYFGPQDEYVVAGSDSGHMWIWNSKPSRVPTSCPSSSSSSSAPFSTAHPHNVCSLVNILKADSYTCNGVAPHPFAPLLVSFGIDRDAKLWHCSATREDANVAAATSSVASSSASSSASTSAAALSENDYKLCYHLGSRDRRNCFLRLSLPIRWFPPTLPKYCDIYSLPIILDKNTLQSGNCGIRGFEPRVIDSNPRTIGPFQFKEMASQLMESLVHRGFELQSEEERNLMKEDVGPYLSTDAISLAMDHGVIDHRQVIVFCVSDSPILFRPRCLTNGLVHGFSLVEYSS